MKIMKNMGAILLLLTMVSFTQMAQAQQSQGVLTLEITEVTSDNPQIQAMSDMFKGSETIVHFKGKQSLTKVNMMGGAVQIDVKVDEAEKSDMLMNMMGQKIWVETTKIENDRMKAEAQSPMSEMEISYNEGDIKEIAGYQCYKMTVTFPDAEGASLEAYITEELDINAPVIQGVEITGFKGFPLEYTFNNGMMSMNIVTKSFEKTVDDSVFDISTDGYKKMTMQEFIQMSGGMGGMGF